MRITSFSNSYISVENNGQEFQFEKVPAFATIKELLIWIKAQVSLDTFPSIPTDKLMDILGVEITDELINNINY